MSVGDVHSVQLASMSFLVVCCIPLNNYVIISLLWLPLITSGNFPLGASQVMKLYISSGETFAGLREHPEGFQGHSVYICPDLVESDKYFPEGKNATCLVLGLHKDDWVENTIWQAYCTLKTH